jgi:hypothetical protein
MRNIFATRHCFASKLIIFKLFISITFGSFSGYSSGLQDPVRLVFRYPENEAINYLSDTKVIMVMNLNGQMIESKIFTNYGFKIKSLGKQGDNLKIEIKLDSLNVTIDNPQGYSKSKVNEITGKSFNMLLSPLGKVVDINEALKIEYQIEGAGKRNISSLFDNFFPDLPATIVKPGDRWTSNDTITADEGTNMILQINSTYEGIEKVNGLECAKIISTLSGTQKIIANAQGMTITTTGTITGSKVVFITISEGFIVKQILKSKMDGNMELSGAQNLSLPVVMDINYTNEIVQ